MPARGRRPRTHTGYSTVGGNPVPPVTSDHEWDLHYQRRQPRITEEEGWEVVDEDTEAEFG